MCGNKISFEVFGIVKIFSDLKLNVARFNLQGFQVYA